MGVSASRHKLVWVLLGCWLGATGVPGVVYGSTNLVEESADWGEVAPSGIWEFVDSDGVLHMGNAVPDMDPEVDRELVWLHKLGALLPYRAGSTLGEKRSAAGASALGKLSKPQYQAVRQHLEAAALSQDLEPALVLAVAAAESAFNVDAVSPKGALGLMQIMPQTAKRYGVVPSRFPVARHPVLEPQLNAEVGARYLADLLRLFDGETDLALAAYNAGEGAVLRHGRKIPPFPETQQYVDRVLRLYAALK